MLGLAFAEIILMWFAIAWMIKKFHAVDRYAAWLQVPYLSWVSFATVLNGSIYYFNR